MKALLRTTLLLISMAVVGSTTGNTGEERVLKFFHTPTGNSLQVVYFRQGEYDLDARDRTGTGPRALTNP